MSHNPPVTIGQKIQEILQVCGPMTSQEIADMLNSMRFQDCIGWLPDNVNQAMRYLRKNYRVIVTKSFSHKNGQKVNVYQLRETPPNDQ